MITREQALWHAPALGGLLACALVPWLLAAGWTAVQHVLDELGHRPT